MFTYTMNVLLPESLLLVAMDNFGYSVYTCEKCKRRLECLMKAAEDMYLLSVSLLRSHYHCMHVQWHRVRNTVVYETEETPTVNQYLFH